MTPGKFISETITINAPVSDVWDALTISDMTRQYMYGCDVISKWRPGSPITWKGALDGVEYVKGHVVTYEPFQTLAFTVFDPNGAYADIPENYLTSTYTLTEENGATILSVSSGDYSLVADGEKRFEHSAQGWSSTLNKLKELVENPPAAKNEVAMHPVVAKVAKALRQLNKKDFYKCFADDVVLIDDGETYDFKAWAEYNIFQYWTSMSVHKVLDGGLTFHLYLYVQIKGKIDRYDSYWKFQVTGDKVTRLETGNLEL